jgi:tRNA-specific 2-thiouridylase
LQQDFTVVNCTWSAIAGIYGEVETLTKIRYNGVAASAIIAPAGSDLEVTGKFVTPQRAITPGQAAVFYGGEHEEYGQVVLGGGTLDELTSHANVAPIRLEEGTLTPLC